MDLSPQQAGVLSMLAKWDMRATVGGYSRGDGLIEPDDLNAANTLHELGLLSWTEDRWATITPAGRRIVQTLI